MASIYKRKTKSGQIVYYGALRINGKLIRKKLAHSLKLAKTELKKLEYYLLLEKTSKIVEVVSLKFAINKFLMEYELFRKVYSNFIILFKIIKSIHFYLSFIPNH